MTKKQKTGIYFDNPYDQKKEYYFVDYHCSYDCRWVRIPYQTWEEVVELVKSLNSEWGFDREDKSMVRFPQDLRITPEKKLAQLHQVFNEKTNKYEDDFINNRTYFFSGRYDIDEEWTGVKSLNKKKGETLADWKKRVAIAKEELEAKRSAAYTETINSIDRIKNQRREDKEKEREETV